MNPRSMLDQTLKRGRLLAAPAAIAAAIGLALADPAAAQTPPPLPLTPATATPSRSAGTPARVGLQAGHWLTGQAPPELAWLRTATGTVGGGTNEWELNLSIARRVAVLLEAEGVQADVLPTTIPPAYQADAFVAIHADGDLSGRLTGYKVARASRSAIPDTDDAFAKIIGREYGAATGLAVDPGISRNMTGYYAFNNRRYQHSIAPATPAVILEMGFLTNASDRRTLLGAQDRMAQGIARGALEFLRANRPASPAASTPPDNSLRTEGAARTGNSPTAENSPLAPSSSMSARSPLSDISEPSDQPSLSAGASVSDRWYLREKGW